MPQSRRSWRRLPRATARRSGVEVKVHTVTGDPADALLEVAERGESEPDRRRQPRDAWRVASARERAEQDLHRAGCSVLIACTTEPAP